MAHLKDGTMHHPLALRGTDSGIRGTEHRMAWRICDEHQPVPRQPLGSLLQHDDYPHRIVWFPHQTALATCTRHQLHRSALDGLFRSSLSPPAILPLHPHRLRSQHLRPLGRLHCPPRFRLRTLHLARPLRRKSPLVKWTLEEKELNILFLPAGMVVAFREARNEAASGMRTDIGGQREKELNIRNFWKCFFAPQITQMDTDFFLTRILGVSTAPAMRDVLFISHRCLR